MIVADLEDYDRLKKRDATSTATIALQDSIIFNQAKIITNFQIMQRNTDMQLQNNQALLADREEAVRDLEQRLKKQIRIGRLRIVLFTAAAAGAVYLFAR